MRRRDFLALLGVGAAAACTDRSTTTAPTTTTVAPTSTTASTLPAPVNAPTVEPGSPFALGVASGDPLPESVILWTRVTSDADVEWEVAEDSAFARRVASGVAAADPAFGHSVHVDAAGLSPGTEYWYRFRADGFVSPVGRTRTAASDGHVRLAFASCQDRKDGNYNAHSYLAAEDVDAVLWVGDYLYASATTVAEYREQYAVYKADPALQAAHAAAPWILTWDDHEVANNYNASVDPAQRAAAYQAWWEHTPVRLPPPSGGGPYVINRVVPFGEVLAVHVIDGRQFRSPQGCGGGLSDLCPEDDDPSRTMLGAEQETWLADSLAASGARWNVIANQVVMTDCAVSLGSGTTVNHDQWDGYRPARERLLTAVRDAGVSNPIVVTGDLHAALVGDLTVGGAVVGTEFVGPSISSEFPESLRDDFGALALVAADVQHSDAEQHGYVVLDLTPEVCRAEYRVVSTVVEPTATLTTSTTWVVENGRPGAARA